MASRMNRFHDYFRQSFKQIWELADSFRAEGMSLREYIRLADEFVHHRQSITSTRLSLAQSFFGLSTLWQTVESHHGYEERLIFPLLAKRMPEFQDAHVEE